MPGCEPGPDVAACSSGSGEKAMAIAKAKTAIRVFLMRISKYLPFQYSATAIPRARQQAKRSAPLPVRDSAGED